MRIRAPLAIGLVLAKPAIAQKAEAGAAFQRGKSLMAQGRTAEACSEFETSMRLEPLHGTLYNLALCHEALGKIASAWTELKELAANDKNAPRAKDAAKRAAALEKKLTRMRIVVATPTDGLVIKRNDVDVTALAGKDIPVDPGKYTFVASAPGRTEASQELDLSTPGATIDVTIPALAEASVDQPPPPDAAIVTDAYADRGTLRPVALPRGVIEGEVSEVWGSSSGFDQDSLDTRLEGRMGLGNFEVHAGIVIHTRYARDAMRPVLTNNVIAGGDYIISPLFAAGIEVKKFHPFGDDIEQGFDFRADFTGKRIISPSVALVGSGGFGYQSRQTRGQSPAPSEFGLLGDGTVQLAPIRRLTLEALTRIRLNVSGDLYGDFIHIEVAARATAALTRHLDAFIQTSLYVLPRSAEFDTRLVTLGALYRHP